MIKKIRNIAMWVLAGWLSVACSDDLVDGTSHSEQEDGIAFTIGVEEQADLIYRMGQTRSTGSGQARLAGEPVLDSLTDAANTARAIPLAGGDGLCVHRMPLPLVGIHRKAVHQEFPENGLTRAPLSEIAGNGIAFHDSLTIWGFTDKGRTLFNGVLLKKVRGWRSSVHWPYDKEGVESAQLNPQYMKFYAISPAVESLEDLSTTTAPTYSTQPTFTYKVPNDIGVQRDLVYGESTVNTSSDAWGNVAVQTGPDGSSTSDPKTENLGEDNKLVKLKFRHILTAIRFAQGKMPTGATITNLQISSVNNNGTYSPGTNTWGSLNGSATYSVPVSTAVSEYNPVNTYIDGGNVLFLMPQTVPSGAVLTVSMRVGGLSHTLTASLEGDTWLPGYTVTYKVTVGELQGDYYLVVEPDASYAASGVVATPTQSGTGTSDKYSSASDSYEHGDAVSGSFIIHSFRNYKNYGQNASGVNNHHAVGWKVVGFADPAADFAHADYTYNNPHAVSWVTSFTGWNSADATQAEQAGGDYQVINYTMAAQSASPQNHASILQANNALASTLNLSTHLPNGATSAGDPMTGYSGGSIYHSANSYIVNASGTYSFPLVYGNSYQNGAAVDLSSNTLFVDHAGRTITHANILSQVNYTVSSDVSEPASTADISSYPAAHHTLVTTDVLYNNSGNDISASIVWQDVNNLFQSPVVVGSTIQFTVSSTPQPGNCVIAFTGKKTIRTTRRIYDSSDHLLGTVVSPAAGVESLSPAEILWTWHIWCTDEVYPNAGTVDSRYPQYANGSKIVSLQDAGGTEPARILPVNLGWVPDNMDFNRYEAREIWVKIQQTEPSGSEQVAYFKLRREARQDLVTGTSTIYQWGRPTALPMKAKLDAAARTCYNGSGSAVAFSSSAITTPAAAIAAPTTMATGWNPAVAYWSDGSKTLYDPCPPGYQLPASTVFNGFSLTGATTAVPSQLNMWPAEGASGQGGYFYAKAQTALPASDASSRYDSKVYIPVTGTWTDSYVQGNTSAGYYWTGTSGTSWQVLPDNSSGWITFGATNLGNGYALPIRAKAE